MTLFVCVFFIVGIEDVDEPRFDFDVVDIGRSLLAATVRIGSSTCIAPETELKDVLSSIVLAALAKQQTRMPVTATGQSEWPSNDLPIQNAGGKNSLNQTKL